MGETSQQPHVDQILMALGPRGRYQILLSVISSLAAFPACLQLLNNVFLIRKMPHHCAAPANDSEFWTKYSNLDHMNVTYETCSIKISVNNSVIATETCIAGHEFDDPVEYSVSSEFNLVCETAALAKLSQTLLIGGQGVGAFLITIVSDRFGRKLALVGSNFGLLVCGLVITFSPNYLVFAIFKFTIGGFQQGVVAGLSTYLIELYVQDDRRLGGLLVGVAWATAAGGLPLVAYLLRFHSWRYLQLTLTLTALASILQWWLLDESIRWLLANGKTKEALKCIKRAAWYNRKDFHEVIMKSGLKVDASDGHHSNTATEMTVTAEVNSPLKDVSHTNPDTDENEEVLAVSASKKMSILDLLKVRRLLINALSIWFAWFTVALGYFALYLTATSLHGNGYVNFAMVALMTFPSRILSYLCLNRFGRKKTTMLMYSLLGIGLLVSGVSRSFGETNIEIFGKITLISYMVAMIGASGCFGLVFFYTPELFPTNMRNQAVGLSSLIGRFGGMLAPFTSVLAEQVVWGPGVLMGCFAIIVCLLVGLVLPETRTRELPQTVEELQNWYKKDDQAEGGIRKDKM